MGQKILVKVIFDSSKDSWENFGNNRYILKLSYSEDLDSLGIVSEYISRQVGVPASKIEFQGKDSRKYWMFEIL